MGYSMRLLLKYIRAEKIACLTNVNQYFVFLQRFKMFLYYN